MKRLLNVLLLLCLVPFLMASGYNYSYYGEVIHSAPGMTFATYFNAQTLGTSLSSPEDLVVYGDYIYIVDSQEHSLIVVDKDFNLVEEVSVFDVSTDYANANPGVTEETLDSPEGIDVTENGIFICDTNNFRIVKLDHNYDVVDTYSEIDDETFEAIDFQPLKITVDSTDRMYVVANNVYEGILEINYDGSFNRFTGVNPIQLTPFEIFARNWLTEEQIAQLQLYLPTEYTNVNINNKNFIYATSKVSENNNENTIQLINPKGVDVIKRNGYFPPMADIQFVVGTNNYVIDGPSELVDIAWTKDGIYTVLDQKRSRLFTYDEEGNLLYINGDEGSQSDKFSEGTAIDYLGDDLLILDRGTKTIVVYQLTDFGEKVNSAIHYHNEGEFEQAAEVWKEVIKINTNYEIAYNGIGKLLLRQGEFKEAMEYFEQGHDQYYYSKAYKEYRKEVLEENFGVISITIITLVVGIIGYRIFKTYQRGGSILYED